MPSEGKRSQDPQALLLIFSSKRKCGWEPELGCQLMTGEAASNKRLFVQSHFAGILSQVQFCKNMVKLTKIHPSLERLKRFDVGDPQAHRRFFDSIAIDLAIKAVGLFRSDISSRLIVCAAVGLVQCHETRCTGKRGIRNFGVVWLSRISTKHSVSRTHLASFEIWQQSAPTGLLEGLV